jgi:ectoine hydroxylase-related dioxygenase (phytanoyl-CoA dioxygenase family)
MLTQQEIDFYHAEGYLVVKDVLGPAELDEAHDIIDDFIEKSRQIVEQSGHFDLEPDHSADNPKVRRMSNK